MHNGRTPITLYRTHIAIVLSPLNVLGALICNSVRVRSTTVHVQSSSFVLDLGPMGHLFIGLITSHRARFVWIDWSHWLMECVDVGVGNLE